MEAMRTRTKTSCQIPIEIEKLDVLYLEILSSWCDYTTRTRPIKVILGVRGSANNECPVNLGIIISIFISKRKLYTS